MKTPVRVAVTGAAGQIGYSLLFRIASGAMLGTDQPVILQLLEITPALDALKGVAMELDDCAFPLLAGVVQSDDPNVAFGDVNYALLVGSRPRSMPGALFMAISALVLAGLPTTRIRTSAAALSLNALPCTVKMAPLASRRSLRSMPFERGREPTSRA